MSEKRNFPSLDTDEGRGGEGSTDGNKNKGRDYFSVSWPRYCGQLCRRQKATVLKGGVINPGAKGKGGVGIQRITERSGLKGKQKGAYLEEARKGKVQRRGNLRGSAGRKRLLGRKKVRAPSGGGVKPK